MLFYFAIFLCFFTICYANEEKGRDLGTVGIDIPSGLKAHFGLDGDVCDEISGNCGSYALDTSFVTDRFGRTGKAI